MTCPLLGTKGLMDNGTLKYGSRHEVCLTVGLVKPVILEAMKPETLA